MRTIKYHQFGPPRDVLYVANESIPLYKDDEVLIRVQLRSINPSDLLTIKGTYPSRIQLPAIPGYEGMGIVVKKGKAVTNFSIDQRVLTLRGMWASSSLESESFSKEIHTSGTWQEYLIMKAQAVIALPDEIDSITAAQLYINPLTAWLMLKELKLGRGDILIANACGSAIGQIFAKYAPIFGYELIGVTNSCTSTNILKNIGVKKVINTSKEPLLETLLSYTKGRKAFAALDAIGGKEGIDLAHCVQDGGSMLLYGLLSGEQHPQDTRTSLNSRIKIKNYWLRNWVYTMPLNERIAIFSDMIDHFVRYSISLPAGPIYDLDEIRNAVISSELSNRIGKVLLSG